MSSFERQPYSTNPMPSKDSIGKKRSRMHRTQQKRISPGKKKCKINMKKLFPLLLFLIPAFLQAQSNNVSWALYQARLASNKQNPSYNPAKAFTLYQQYARQGVAEAMNGLGNLYNEGIGTAVDERAALDWFAKAAAAGYARAWYNLGLMYKNGFGQGQDFVKAFDCYTRGAALNDAMSFYGMGYMQYKGFGTPQSYANALQSFRKAAVSHETNSMYMIGLCFRNGYGMDANIDSARYWLTQASNRGLKNATEELATPTPENSNIRSIPNIQPPVAGQDLGSGYYQVKYQVPVHDIAGEYAGYAIKFDWSGQYIIAESPLKLTLSRNDTTLIGQWSEGDDLPNNLVASITDTALVFNNTIVSRKDHYNQQSANDLAFRNASLQLIKSNGMVYLAGNLRLFSINHNEPEKPEFILFARTGGLPDSLDSKSDLAADSAQFTAYPNPFINRIQVQYALQKACTVRMMVTDLGSAHILYQGLPQYMQAGEHSDAININAARGSYVVTLWYGNRLRSTVLVKQ
jgi:hypothetical protein